MGLMFLGILLSANTGWAQLRVEPDKENVVASRLEGQWVADAELTKRLGGRGPAQVAFKSDATVTAKIPAKYDVFLKDKRIYMAGTMVVQGKVSPFILIEHNGNPHIVFFRDRNGEPLGDEESSIVMLAAAKDRRDDLLFMGGDFNNEPFAAYRRAEPGAGREGRQWKLVLCQRLVLGLCATGSASANLYGV